MPSIRDEAVVLTRLDYSESSLILALFTREHGKVRAIAKGIRRSTKTRFAAGIDLLEVGQVVASSRHERGEALATLTEWKQTRSLFGLREKLFRVHAALYAAEITGHLTEDWDPHPELYESLIATLIALCDAPEPLRSVCTYQLALLESIGSLPRFEACVLCGRGEDLTHFSSFEGGLVCRHCEAGRVEKREVASGVVRFLQGERDVASLVGVFSTLNYHIGHLMGREPSLAADVVSRASQRRVE
jgi:DNA repair protein RecO (recombination protein O)